VMSFIFISFKCSPFIFRLFFHFGVILWKVTWGPITNFTTLVIGFAGDKTPAPLITDSGLSSSSVQVSWAVLGSICQLWVQNIIFLTVVQKPALLSSGSLSLLLSSFLWYPNYWVYFELVYQLPQNHY
jgi:hypothetical protein